MRFIKVFLALIVAIGIFSCDKDKKYSEIPEILSAEFYLVSDSAEIVMIFTDGDGDVGLAESDVDPPFHAYDYLPSGDSVPNKYFYNIFLDFELKNNGEWEAIEFSGGTNTRAPILTPKGQNKQIRATFTNHLTLEQFDYISELGDTVRATIQIVDRALHESNIMHTNELIIP